MEFTKYLLINNKMQIFLILKHWQLFGLLIILQIVSMVAIISEQATMMFVAFLLFCGILLGWFYTLGVNLNKRLPDQVKMNLTKFKWCIVIVVAYMIFYGAFVSYFWLNTDRAGNFACILPFHFLSMLCMLYCLYFVAKSLKIVELKRPDTQGSYIKELFLFCLFPIGIWIIQPRINKIFESSLQKKTVNLSL